jgi:hypothetical protein
MAKTGSNLALLVLVRSGAGFGTELLEQAVVTNEAIRKNKLCFWISEKS